MTATTAELNDVQTYARAALATIRETDTQVGVSSAISRLAKAVDKLAEVVVSQDARLDAICETVYSDRATNMLDELDSKTDDLLGAEHPSVRSFVEDAEWIGSNDDVKASIEKLVEVLLARHDFSDTQRHDTVPFGARYSGDDKKYATQPFDLITQVDKSANDKNVLIRLGRTLSSSDYRWEKSAHVVLTRSEAAALVREIVSEL